MRVMLPADDAMSRYARGDDTAFQELYASTHGRVLALFRRLGCPPD